MGDVGRGIRGWEKGFMYALRRWRCFDAEREGGRDTERERERESKLREGKVKRRIEG